MESRTNSHSCLPQFVGYKGKQVTHAMYMRVHTYVHLVPCGTITADPVSTGTVQKSPTTTSTDHLKIFADSE